jgi:hypothetical protein
VKNVVEDGKPQIFKKEPLSPLIFPVQSVAKKLYLLLKEGKNHIEFVYFVRYFSSGMNENRFKELF